jgi:hypothetical protein
MAKFTVTCKGVAFKSAEYDFLSEAVKRAKKEAIKGNAAVTIHRAEPKEQHIYDYSGRYAFSDGPDGEYQSDYVSRL